MNLKMSNQNNLRYMIIFYLGLALFLFVFISERTKPFEDGLAISVFYGGYLTFIGLIIFVLRDVSISLSINSNEVIYRKWVYFFIKTEKIILDDVETVDATTSLTSGAKLVFKLKNGRRSQISLFYLKDVIGETEVVILGKYAPSDPKLLLGLKLAKTISMNSQVKFNTAYLEN